MNKELTHFGVKGMKWGKRKLDPKITDAKNRLKEVKKEYNKATGYGMIVAPPELQKKLRLATKEVRYAKEDYVNNNILSKISKMTKSDLQLDLEKKYSSKGLSEEEASVAAYKNIQTKKMLTAIGATVLVAGAGYAAYKIHDKRIDQIIKKGTILQNISTDDTMGIRDAFYSSSNKLDNSKYVGLYGATLKSRGNKVFKKEIEVLSDIRKASPENAKKILDEMLKNDVAFKKDFIQYIDETRGHGAGIRDKAVDGLRDLVINGKVTDNLYNTFNVSLVDHGPEAQPLIDKFYGELTKKGYNALKDVNDSKYSGYKSLNPIIAFNSKGVVEVKNVKELAEKEISKSGKIAAAHIVTVESVKIGAAYATSFFGAMGASKVVKSKVDQKLINDYKKNHPNTKMSNTEIIRSIERRS